MSFYRKALFVRTLKTASVKAFIREYGSKSVRIGCASGFWGDTATSVPQLIHGGSLNYLVFDYLAEITMSLLAKAKIKMPEMGYPPDFVHFAMKPFLSEIKSSGLRVISNAGGINPLACGAALAKACRDADVNLRIAVVTGDDLIEQKKHFQLKQVVDMDSKVSFPDEVHSINAYLGAGAIARALDLGADVVLTGRCVDSAVTLGPLIHEFGWKMDEFDKLAAGSLAGHLIECGAQSTGGIFTDWESIQGMDNMGFPIVECDEHGQFDLTKPPETGGAVTVPTVAEQLLYEIGNPRQYILPDVVCDFSQVTLEQKADNCVAVKGAKGYAPPNSYKVSATYSDGYRLTAVAPIIGPKARAKSLKSAEAVLNRCRRMFAFLGMDDFKRTHIEVLGTGQNYGRNASPAEQESREGVLWVAALHEQKNALHVLAREMAASGTGGPPGFTVALGGRPRPSAVLKLFSFLHPKQDADIKIHFEGQVEDYRDTLFDEKPNAAACPLEKEDNHLLPEGSRTCRLADLAFTRSGDKGDSANIGVISRDPSMFPYLKKHLTSEVVANYFSHLFESPELALQNVERFELPGVCALNFVLKNALGGGGVSSLRSDPQGKALGQILLDLKLEKIP